MTMNIVSPTSARVMPPAGIAPLVPGECATLAQVAYGAVTADAFFDVASSEDRTPNAVPVERPLDK